MPLDPTHHLTLRSFGDIDTSASLGAYYDSNQPDINVTFLKLSADIKNSTNIDIYIDSLSNGQVRVV